MQAVFTHQNSEMDIQILAIGSFLNGGYFCLSSCLMACWHVHPCGSFRVVFQRKGKKGQELVDEASIQIYLKFHHQKQSFRIKIPIFFIILLKT